MKRMRVLVLVAMAAVPLVMGASADAACVTAEVVVHRAGYASLPVVPAGTCVVPTPWPANGEVGAEYRDSSMPPGAPNGLDAWVGLTSP